MTSVSLKGARLLRLSIHNSALRWPRRRVLAAGAVRSRDVSRGTWEHATRLSSSVSEVVPIGLEPCGSVHSSGVRPREAVVAGPSWPDRHGLPCFTWNMGGGLLVRGCNAVAETGRARRAQCAVAGWLALEITPIGCVGPDVSVSRETAAVYDGPGVGSDRLRDASSLPLPQCRITPVRRMARCGQRSERRPTM